MVPVKLMIMVGTREGGKETNTNCTLLGRTVKGNLHRAPENGNILRLMVPWSDMDGRMGSACFEYTQVEEVLETGGGHVYAVLEPYDNTLHDYPDEITPDDMERVQEEIVQGFLNIGFTED